MDFKYINDKSDRHGTPKSDISKFAKSRVGNNSNFESPLCFLQNVSTPPSRFTKIVNPFEQHLVDRLHLPTFSPSVFAHVSTPKSEGKFKWTIDEISSLKPADIDEATISQHIHLEDPHVESIVQQKIDTFFSEEKIIVPSPMHTEIKPVSLIKSHGSLPTNKMGIDGSTQTILTLPPILPKHVEEALKPYFVCNDEEDLPKIEQDSFSRKLFSCETPSSSKCSPNSPSRTDSTPIQLSPCRPIRELKDEDVIPHLNDCTLSPISKIPREQSRSVCRLNFSGRMSVDASLVVPDVENPMSRSTVLISHDDSYHAIMGKEITNTTTNWDMEYRQVSISSPTNSNSSDKMEVSTTPSSRIFTSQRKRLSESFKNEDHFREFEGYSEIKQNRNKIFRSNTTESGYHTEGATCNEDSSWGPSNFFASTPTKNKGLMNLDDLL